MYKIPLFDLNYDEREESAIIETLRSKWISIGPKTQEFESKFAKAINIKFALALANCTTSLHLALLAVNIKEGDEVICPSLTFVATVNAIKYVNAIPVFADIVSYDDLTIDPIDIERKITSKTKAIIVMHYGGFACDMDKILCIAGKYDLKVIEDASHGPLAEYNGQKLGTFGHVSCFSFFSNKNIGTGEGGMLVTNDESIYQHVKLWRSHGMTTMSYERSKGHSVEYDVVELGYNYRMDDIRATLGIVQLEKLDKDLQKRVEIRNNYIELLGDVENIILPFQNFRSFSSNYILPVILRQSDSNNRKRVREKLAESGIQTSVHYPAVHRFSIYKENEVYLPVTEYVSDNLISLPIYSTLTLESIILIIKKLKSCI
jgi:dTDP-4-amino-4,6-dideoxygalactose transaminase